MERERVTIVVSVNTDPVPGWGNDPNDYVKHIQRLLDETIPHYNPTVRLSEVHEDFTNSFSAGNTDQEIATPSF